MVPHIPGEIVVNINKFLDVGAFDKEREMSRNGGDRSRSIIGERFLGVRILDLYAERNDPHRYLRSLTDRTHELFSSMMETGTILVGPMATLYFYPESLLGDYSWDFVCQSGAVHFVEF